jgi:hypothetical protein
MSSKHNHIPQSLRDVDESPDRQIKHTTGQSDCIVDLSSRSRGSLSFAP